MNCPQCDLQALPDQKFCRSCGASLKMITQPLAKYATESHFEATGGVILKDERRRASRVTPLGFTIMFIGVAIGIIGKMLMHQDVVTVIGILASLVGMFLTVYPYLSTSRTPRYNDDPTSSPEVPAQSQPAKYLPESRIEPLPSITERTTDLLKNSPPTQQKRG